jgi:inorganic pyrophosphatase
LRDEISHFFAVYKTLEDKTVEVDGWYPREDAVKVIEESRNRYAERQQDPEGHEP